MSDHAVKVLAPSGWIDLAYIATGPQGPAGPKGDKGDTGPAGASGIPPVVTELPGSPTDGQSVLYRFAQTVVPADAQTLLWHLRYDGALANWLPVGEQQPVFAQDTGNRAQVFSANLWGTWAAQALTLTVPLAGVYRVRFGASKFWNSAGVGGNWYVGLHDGSAWPPADQSGGLIAAGMSPSNFTGMHGSQKRSFAAAAGLMFGGWVGTAGTVNAQNRYIELYPVRVG